MIHGNDLVINEYSCFPQQVWAISFFKSGNQYTPGYENYGGYAT